MTTETVHRYRRMARIFKDNPRKYDVRYDGRPRRHLGKFRGMRQRDNGWHFYSNGWLYTVMLARNCDWEDDQAPDVDYFGYVCNCGEFVGSKECKHVWRVVEKATECHEKGWTEPQDGGTSFCYGAKKPVEIDYVNL